ncbi:hypothetical protein ACLMAL_17215 [Nocardia sp. CWNU-33]|uniref:hypothetical protein n=1 Tax=Nocardia sp. CWNU-33 TaxID=3392117 RepID=UPI00398E7C37
MMPLGYGYLRLDVAGCSIQKCESEIRLLAAREGIELGMVFQEQGDSTAALTTLTAELLRSQSQHVLVPSRQHLVGPGMPEKAFETFVWNEAHACVLAASAVDGGEVRSSVSPVSVAELQLAATTTAVSMAQIHARLTLSQWLLDDLTDTAEQIMTELVGEAVQATELRVLTVRVGRTEQKLVIEVSDARPRFSVTGLSFNPTVAALSRRYGRFRSGDSTITTWCELAIAGHTTAPIGGSHAIT